MGCNVILSVMNSIESLKLDFNLQQGELSNIHNEKKFDDCIYVGSGDSYVAGLIAEYMTDRKCRCYSPSDLFNSRFNDDKTYCFISVTGKTTANIKVAERATESGANTIAVTFDRNSKLAQVCRETVLLKITRAQTPTAGFSSFVANVITCLQLAGLVVPQKFDMWRKKGVQLSLQSLNSIALTRDESVDLLGNNLLYAIALYASFQLAEFFGTTAHAHKLEEFCHSPIFGFRKPNQLWIFGQNDEQISERLGKLGLHLSYNELYNQDVFAQLFETIFFIQSLILLLAEKNGYSEMQYVKMKEVLQTSSEIIY
jgi:fructoselysine-6-P-deglycase FrlB-like protein